MAETALAEKPQRPSALAVMGARFGIEPDRVLPILRNTVIKPRKGGRQATNEEVAAFVIVANQYELNPFTREIHAFLSEGGVVPIVGVDGWITLVNRQSAFDGCELDLEYGKDGKPIAATCRMHHKDRTHPTVVTELFSECKRPTAPWNTMPSRMLRHKAYMQAARLCFGLSGIYDEDEGRDIVRRHAVVGSGAADFDIDPDPAKGLAQRLTHQRSEPEPEPGPDYQPDDQPPDEPMPDELETQDDEPVTPGLLSITEPCAIVDVIGAVAICSTGKRGSLNVTTLKLEDDTGSAVIDIVGRHRFEQGDIVIARGVAVAEKGGTHRGESVEPYRDGAAT